MQLQVHPGESPGAVRALAVTAARAGDSLALTWALDADLAQIRLPAAAEPAHTDGLWRHTCFEAFIAVVAEAGATRYCELNFAPSGQWAAYGFGGYRQAMTALPLASPPLAGWLREPGRLELDVSLRVADLLPGAEQRALRIALAAVVEGASGTITHWALRHPPGRPDFHHPDAFILELPGAPRAGGKATHP